jgi:prophage DNA circulation protein
MDHRTGQSQRNSEEQQTALTEIMERVEAQVQETVVGLKATVESAIEGFKQLQQTVDGSKAAVDAMLENVKGTVNETAACMKPMADLLAQLQQNPWLLVGSAILPGYILCSLARENISAR